MCYESFGRRGIYAQEHAEIPGEASGGQERIRWIARGRMSVNDGFHLARIGQVGEEWILLIMLCGGETAESRHTWLDAQLVCWFTGKLNFGCKICLV